MNFHKPRKLWVLLVVGLLSAGVGVQIGAPNCRPVPKYEAIYLASSHSENQPGNLVWAMGINQAGSTIVGKSGYPGIGYPFIALQWNMNANPVANDSVDATALAFSAAAFDVNDSGTVVGEFYRNMFAGGSEAVSWDANGNISSLDLPPQGGFTNAISLNNAGQIFGTSGDGTRALDPTVWNPDRTIYWSTEFSGFLLPTMYRVLTEDGFLLLSSEDGLNRIYNLQNGTIHTEFQHEGYGMFVSMNSSKVAVGRLHSEVGRAVKFSNGTIEDLPLPVDFSDGSAHLISESGTIVGYGRSPNSAELCHETIVWIDGYPYELESILVAAASGEQIPTHIPGSPCPQINDISANGIMVGQLNGRAVMYRPVL